MNTLASYSLIAGVLGLMAGGSILLSERFLISGGTVLIIALGVGSVLSIAGIVMGVVAFKQITPGLERGLWAAIGGIMTGVVGLGIFLFILWASLMTDL